MAEGRNLLVRLDSVDVPLLPSEPEEHLHTDVKIENFCLQINLFEKELELVCTWG